jgi:omega-hydroxy-beta-dihydromenaquinone-9 sulfotransferase
MPQKSAKNSYTLERRQFLVGISPFRLLELLWDNRFNVDPGCWRAIGQLLFISLFAGLSNIGDYWRIARKARDTRITLPPIFIVGHWRSGTTLVHKLLSLDTNLWAPTFFECCLPRGFASGRSVLKQRIASHLTTHRPLDDAPFGIDEPFEDEFVLAKEALLSPMLAAVFPVNGKRHRSRLHIEGLTVRERMRWQETLLDFVKRLTFCHGRRLLLKSPAHSCRIPLLRKLFPGAKFIAVRRDPIDVILSTIDLERQLLLHNALQHSNGMLDKQWIVTRYIDVTQALDEARRDLPAGEFTEIEYMDVCQNPVTTLMNAYSSLNMSPSAAWRAALDDYLTENGYPNPQTRQLAEEYRSQWRTYLCNAMLKSMASPAKVP